MSGFFLTRRELDSKSSYDVSCDVLIGGVGRHYQQGLTEVILHTFNLKH